VCQTCPVRAECAAHALAAREPYGVWSGFTEAERLRLLATGWGDLVDHGHRADVVLLERRLGLRPSNTPTRQRIPAPRRLTSAARIAS